MNINQPLLSLLNDLELELKAQALWSTQQPTQAQLSSQVPFAADVMPFEQWLQFIFITRLKQMIEHSEPLPKSMAISPMGEIVFAEKQPKLQVMLHAIDNLFAEQI